MRPIRMVLYATVATMTVATAASAAHLSYFQANLGTLNSSGVTGQARLTFDSTANTLKVRIKATGLEANQLHVQHIHGLSDSNGNAIDSKSPTIAQDMDGDGFVELTEGATTYGPILLNLFDSAMNFPTAPDGTIDFSTTYDLATTSAFNTGVTAKDLFPLDFREIVIHGMTIPAGIGGVGDGSGNMAAGFSAVLPVASGEFNQVSAVPLPAASLLLLGGLGGLGALRLRRKSS